MSSELAIDFGSSVTRVADAGGAVLFEEPTVAAVDGDTGRLLAFGRDAHGLGARSAGRTRVVHPVRNGKLVEVDLAESVLAEVLNRCGIGRLERVHAVLCSHIDQTAVQDRALERALKKAGVRSVRSIEYPLAAAIGAGVPIAEAVGQMVVDVGGGTTDIAVLALGGIVTSAATDSGVGDIDHAIRTYLYRELGVVVDVSTASELRRVAAAAPITAGRREITVAGREARSGATIKVTLDPAELSMRVERDLAAICAAAVDAISSAPPDLANDLLATGILLCGGGSFLSGLDRRLARATGVPVHVPADPERVGVYGAGRSESGDSGGLALSFRSVG